MLWHKSTACHGDYSLPHKCNGWCRAVLPSPRTNAGLAISPAGPCIWMLGGFDGSNSLGDLWTYDTTTALWSLVRWPASGCFLWGMLVVCSSAMMAYTYG